MRGYLLPGLPLELDPRTMEYGGSFWARRKGVPYACAVAGICYRLLQAWPESLFLDIGSNLGSCALITRYIPGTRCIAFEPNPAVHDILAANLALNGVSDRVEALCIATGPRSGEVYLEVDDNAWRSGFAHLTEQPTINRVPMRTVDEVVGKRGPVRLAKLDVEGYERFVLEGMADILERDHPVIIAECADKWTSRYGYQSREIIRFLARFGYDTVYELTAVDWVITTLRDQDAVEQVVRGRKGIRYMLRTDWYMIGPGYKAMSPEEVRNA